VRSRVTGRRQGNDAATQALEQDAAVFRKIVADGGTLALGTDAP
jgi:hypothetical protein